MGNLKFELANDLMSELERTAARLDELFFSYIRGILWRDLLPGPDYSDWRVDKYKALTQRRFLAEGAIRRYLSLVNVKSHKVALG